jgi:hypothetical protein
MKTVKVYEYGTWKPVKVILRRGRKRGRIKEGMNSTGNAETCQSHFKKGEEKRKNKGGDELNWGTLYTYIEMSQ